MNYMNTLYRWKHATEPVTLNRQERKFFIKLAKELYQSTMGKIVPQYDLHSFSRWYIGSR